VVPLFERPTAVRTASTITASLIANAPDSLLG
jgi:hypothetical protein